MITESNGVFHLQTEHYSYLLKINPWGLPEHLHFGAPISESDAFALSTRIGLGWGCSLLLDTDDTASSPDAMALEWSGSGRGDYRESPLELSGTSSDFRYAGFEILDGSPAIACSLPQAQGAEETLILRFEQSGARLELYYTPYPTALVRRSVLKNTGERTLTMNKLMSMSMDIPGKFRMTTFNGGWIAEMHRQDTLVGRSKVVNESLTGSSSNRSNPGFLLSEPDATEHAGRVYGFNLIYSGNHYGSAQQSLQGLTRVIQGINPSFLVSIS